MDAYESDEQNQKRSIAVRSLYSNDLFLHITLSRRQFPKYELNMKQINKTDILDVFLALLSILRYLGYIIGKYDIQRLPIFTHIHGNRTAQIGISNTDIQNIPSPCLYRICVIT